MMQENTDYFEYSDNCSKPDWLTDGEFETLQKAYEDSIKEESLFRIVTVKNWSDKWWENRKMAKLRAIMKDKRGPTSVDRTSCCGYQTNAVEAHGRFASTRIDGGDSLPGRVLVLHPHATLIKKTVPAPSARRTPRKDINIFHCNVDWASLAKQEQEEILHQTAIVVTK
jgi:hypothetical protein